MIVASPLLLSRETWLWCALAVASLWWHLAPGDRAWFAPDSYQYLSIAHNVAVNGRIATSIVHFDTERAHGRVPAPSTTFPAGYPLPIAALERFGVSDERAALLVSTAAFILLIPILAGLGKSAGLTANALRIALLLWILNYEGAHTGDSIATEMLFSAVSVGALALLAKRGSALAFYFGMALAGAAYHVRYAGLFLVAAVVLFQAGKSIVGSEPWRRTITGIALMVGVVAIGIVRNVLITGGWRGGNDKHVANNPADVLRQFVTSIYHALFSEVPFARSHVFPVLAVVGAIALAGLGLARTKQIFAGLISGQSVNALMLLITYVAVYSAAMIYAGVTSVISFGTRMFIPLIPVLLILLCRFGLEIVRTRRVAVLACAGIAIAYVGENVLAMETPNPPQPHVLVEQRLDGPMLLPANTGTSMRAWIDAHVAPDEVLVSADGQPTAYVLHRDLISVVEPRYSSASWNAEYFHNLMRRFGARHLLLYTEAQGPEPEEEKDSPFFQNLLHGQAPTWLTLEAETRGAELYRCTDCAPRN